MNQDELEKGGLGDIYGFLHVLRFCANIKHEFFEDIKQNQQQEQELDQKMKREQVIKQNQQVLDLYCKLDILPKAREVLNSAEIPYRYGNFVIKIDKDFAEGTNLNSLKLKDWLIGDDEKKSTKKSSWNCLKKPPTETSQPPTDTSQPLSMPENLNSKLVTITEEGSEDGEE
uniref:Uncharacterized protein n=1 Tax=Meloidogyne enterolobii TaxID=390850 RepID=A0A6V7TSE7_MELEN|nr:unnamed protein product [Meloidogyne enterolobii]